MSRKSESITLSVKEGAKEKLEAIALELGFKWGEKPNVSALLNAIAYGELVAIEPETPRPVAFTPSQIDAVKAAIKHFAEIGDFEKVYTLASIVKGE